MHYRSIAIASILGLAAAAYGQDVGAQEQPTWQGFEEQQQAQQGQRAQNQEVIEDRQAQQAQQAQLGGQQQGGQQQGGQQQDEGFDTIQEDKQLVQQTQQFGQQAQQAQQQLNQGGAQGQINVGQIGEQAPVPQYWIADASIFTNNAAVTAQIMLLEQQLSVQAPQILGNQAEYLAATIQRAKQDLDALQENAQATNPGAVEEIRVAAAQLTAALAQATQLAQAASQGELGPTYEVTVRSALEHLQLASQAVKEVAAAYDAQGFAVALSSGAVQGGQQAQQQDQGG